MQTLREILGREDERRNLRDVGICVLLVLALIAGAFGVAHMQFLFEGEAEPVRGESVAIENPQ